MPIRERNQDPILERMIAAFEGDTATWRRATRSLRDAIADHAVRAVPYYRAVVPPGTPFDELPLLTKRTIRERLVELLAEGVPEGRRFRDDTSGSTGTPVTFYRDTTQGPLENISSERFFRRLWGIPPEAHTIQLTGRLVVPSGEPPGRSLLRRRGRETPQPRSRTVLNIHMTPDRLGRELQEWKDFDPYLLLAYPSMLTWIAEQIEDRGLEVPVPPLAVVAMSETLSPGVVDRAARVLGCPVHARYSSNEFSRLAGTLPGSLRYAFNPLLAYVEVLNDDGAPTAPGDVGRLVLTDLNNYVMPFIRYDIGDLARVSEEGWAGGFRIVEEIMGRTTDVIRLPSGRLVSVITLHNILFRTHHFEPYIDAYQCAQTAPNAIQLRIVWRRAPDDALRDAVVSAIVPFMDPDTRVSVTDIPQVERLPSGKGWVVRREF